MPGDGGWGGVAVKLVANIDEILDRGDIDLVNGGEIENDGLEDGLALVDDDGLTTGWSWVIPWAILKVC